MPSNDNAPDTRADLRARLATAVPAARETVMVPEGAPADQQTAVEVRNIPAGIRWQLEREGYDAQDRMIPAKFCPFLLSQACHDPASGMRLYGDSPEELMLVSQLDQSITTPLLAAALRVCGWARTPQTGGRTPGEAQSGAGPGTGSGAVSSWPVNSTSPSMPS
jgi:hypothetical protein